MTTPGENLNEMRVAVAAALIHDRGYLPGIPALERNGKAVTDSNGYTVRESRVRATTDEAWIAAHSTSDGMFNSGGTQIFYDSVVNDKGQPVRNGADIANLPGGLLPDDLKQLNLVAAQDAVPYAVEHSEILDDPEAFAGAIHEQYRSRAGDKIHPAQDVDWKTLTDSPDQYLPNLDRLIAGVVADVVRMNQPQLRETAVALGIEGAGGQTFANA